MEHPIKRLLLLSARFVLQAKRIQRSRKGSGGNNAKAKRPVTQIKDAKFHGMRRMGCKDRSTDLNVCL